MGAAVDWAGRPEAWLGLVLKALRWRWASSIWRWPMTCAILASLRCSRFSGTRSPMATFSGGSGCAARMAASPSFAQSASDAGNGLAFGEAAAIELGVQVEDVAECRQKPVLPH